MVFASMSTAAFAPPLTFTRMPFPPAAPDPATVALPMVFPRIVAFNTPPAGVAAPLKTFMAWKAWPMKLLFKTLAVSDAVLFWSRSTPRLLLLIVAFWMTTDCA